MSVTDIRNAYRNVFQTLRATARSDASTGSAHLNSAEPRKNAERTDAPDVVVTLSGNRIEQDSSQKQDPRITALSERKGRARGKLEELTKRIKLARKIWQYQPRELAKQLVSLSKQLKEILNEYKSVQKELAKLLGPGIGAASGGVPAGLSGLTAAPPVPAGETETAENEPEADSDVSEAQELDAHTSRETDTQTTEASAETDAPEVNESAPEATPGTSFSYGDTKFERVRLDQTPVAMELRSDIEFAAQAKGLSEMLKEAFQDVKRWAIGFKQDSKDDQKLYDATEKVLNDLHKELRDYESELKRAMPPAIWVTQPVATG